MTGEELLHDAVMFVLGGIGGWCFYIAIVCLIEFVSSKRWTGGK
jgi:hypothetical protein